MTEDLRELARTTSEAIESGSLGRAGCTIARSAVTAALAGRAGAPPIAVVNEGISGARILDLKLLMGR